MLSKRSHILPRPGVTLRRQCRETLAQDVQLTLRTPDDFRRLEGAHGRQRLLPALDFDHIGAAARALAELRSAAVMRQHIGIAMDADRAVLGAGRIVPSPARPRATSY